MGRKASRGRLRTPQTTDSRHDLPIAANLLGRSFTAERPDAVWRADISDIPTDEGFVSLAALKDGPQGHGDAPEPDRRLVDGGSPKGGGLCLDALVMAFERE